MNKRNIIQKIRNSNQNLNVIGKILIAPMGMTSATDIDIIGRNFV